MKKFKWEQTDLTPDQLFEKYTLESRLDIKKKLMSVRDFLFAAIELAVKDIKMENCEHCFKDTKKKIDEVFAYMDCDHSNYLNATEILNALKNLNQDETFRIPIKNSLVNDFVLKLMDPQSATVNLKEFQYGILMGLMERFFSVEGVPTIDKVQQMKHYRFEKIRNGYGPKRR